MAPRSAPIVTAVAVVFFELASLASEVGFVGRVVVKRGEAALEESGFFWEVRDGMVGVGVGMMVCV